MISLDDERKIVKSAIIALIAAHRAEFDHLLAEGKRLTQEKK